MKKFITGFLVSCFLFLSIGAGFRQFYCGNWVAASDAPVWFKALAGYRCDGTADDVQVQAAINALYADGGGEVELSKGTFTIATSITLKSGVSIEGVRPLLTVSDAIATLAAPGDSFTITGGTILDGAVGNETIFSANTSVRPATDYAITGVEISNLGFNDVGCAIDVGGQDNSGFALSKLSNLFVVDATDTAFKLGNFQFLRVDGLYMRNVERGIYAYNWHRIYEGGNSYWNDIFIYLVNDGEYGIKLCALPSGSGVSSLNYLYGERWQVNCFAGGMATANMILEGTNSIFDIDTVVDGSHIDLADTTTTDYWFAGAASGDDKNVLTVRAADDGSTIGTYRIKTVTEVGGKTRLETWETTLVTDGVVDTHKVRMKVALEYSPVNMCNIKGLDLEGPYATNPLTLTRTRNCYLQIASAFEGVTTVTNSPYNTIESQDPDSEFSVDATSNPCFVSGIWANIVGDGAIKPMGLYYSLADQKQVLSPSRILTDYQLQEVGKTTSYIHREVPSPQTLTSETGIDTGRSPLIYYNNSAKVTAVMDRASSNVGIHFTITKISATTVDTTKDVVISVAASDYLNGVQNGTLTMTDIGDSVELVGTYRASGDADYGDWKVVWKNFE